MNGSETRTVAVSALLEGAAINATVPMIGVSKPTMLMLLRNCDV